MQLNDLTDLKQDICVLAELIILMPIFFPCYCSLQKVPGISFQLIEAGSWELIDMLKMTK